MHGRGGHAWQGVGAWLGRRRGHAWQGCVWQGACMAGRAWQGVHGRGACRQEETITEAGGMHPTGMHPCHQYYYNIPSVIEFNDCLVDISVA